MLSRGGSLLVPQSCCLTSQRQTWTATKAIEDVVRAVAASGIKVVMSTHDLGEARRVAGEIVLLHRGRIVERGTAAEFLKNRRGQIVYLRRIADMSATTSNISNFMRALVITTGLVTALVGQTAAQKRSIIVASTTSTQDSGLFGYLLPIFKQKTGIDVKVVAQGTGQALDTARRCRCGFRPRRG